MESFDHYISLNRMMGLSRRRELKDLITWFGVFRDIRSVFEFGHCACK